MRLPPTRCFIRQQGVGEGKSRACNVKLKKKTGNIAAVQRQIGHKNAAYPMQYVWITE